jgi:hypothetical protein
MSRKECVDIQSKGQKCLFIINLNFGSDSEKGQYEYFPRQHDF